MICKLCAICEREVLFLAHPTSFTWSPNNYSRCFVVSTSCVVFVMSGIVVVAVVVVVVVVDVGVVSVVTLRAL